MVHQKMAFVAGETRPLILCEYAHAMGNSLGGFAKYWQAFRQYPRLQGGFVWDWVDQSLIKYDDEMAIRGRLTAVILAIRRMIASSA